MSTRIEWADDVWNPTVGCSRVSPGCDGCYAMRTAHRGLAAQHRGLTVHAPGTGVDWTGEVRCLPHRLDIPLRRRAPTRWFVDSMSDLFHPQVPPGFVAEVLARTLVTPRHAYLVLTKRPRHMVRLFDDPNLGREVGHIVEDLINGRPPDGIDPAPYFDAERRVDAGGPLFPNLWLGTSIENDTYTWRADHVRRLGDAAGVRWLSLEPLLGPLPSLDLTGIDWVVAGGESGPGARPMHPDWVRDIRDRCTAANVPFFFKQWGAWAPQAGTDDLQRVGKTAAGHLLDGRTWQQLPTHAQPTTPRAGRAARPGPDDGPLSVHRWHR